MHHIVKYKGIPEIWEIHPGEDILRHLGSNYSITGKEFLKRDAAKTCLRDMIALEKVTKQN